MPESLEIPKGSMGPSDKDVMAQLSSAHPVQMSESKVIAVDIDIFTSSCQQKFSIPYSTLITSSTSTATWSEATTASAPNLGTWWNSTQQAKSVVCRSCHRATSPVTSCWAWMRWSHQLISSARQNSPKKCRSRTLSLKSDWESCKDFFVRNFWSGREEGLSWAGVKLSHLDSWENFR